MRRGEGEKEVGIIGCREQETLIEMTIQLIISYSMSYTLKSALKAHAWSLYAAYPRSCTRVTYAQPTLNMKNAALILIWVKRSFREDTEHIHSPDERKDNQVVRPQNMDKITLRIKYGAEILS